MTTLHGLAWRGAPALICALLLGGCMAGPDFQPPAPPRVARYTAQALPGSVGSGRDAQRFVAGIGADREWWKQFGSAQLDALVARALAVNPSIASAQAALRAAQENTAAQRATLWPSVSADFSPSRQRIAGTLASPAASGYGYYSLHTAQLSVSYAPDLFGGNRRQVESLEAEAQLQRCQLDAAYVSLVTNVVAAAINEAALGDQLQAAQRSIDAQQQILASFQRQLALGQVSQADLAAQQAALAQAQGLLPPLRRQLDQQRDALAALLGVAPAAAPATHFTLADLHLPRDLPVSLPSQLVGQRPDVCAAAAQLHAASAEVGIATANRLPKFTLSAGTGSAATDIAALFARGTVFWSLAADIAQPLFDGGALRHQQRAAQANYAAAAAQYRGVVLAALQNVADTLYALQADAAATQAAQAAAQAATRSLAIARRQWQLGDISQVALLAAGQAEQQTRIALVAARASRYADTAALFQALGGGWQPGPTVMPANR